MWIFEGIGTIFRSQIWEKELRMRVIAAKLERYPIRLNVLNGQSF